MSSMLQTAGPLPFAYLLSGAGSSSEREDIDWIEEERDKITNIYLTPVPGTLWWIILIL